MNIRPIVKTVLFAAAVGLAGGAFADATPFAIGDSSVAAHPVDGSCPTGQTPGSGGFSSLVCFDSPVILKINSDGTTDVNGDWDGLITGDADGAGTSGDPWLFNGFTVWLTGSTRIDWSYDESGPLVTYFLVKFGNHEYYYGDGSTQSSGWASASGSGSGVSHIEFYDHGGSVPTPATLALLGLGALGLGLSRRRKQA